MLQKNNLIFGELVSFSEAFPSIEDITVKITELNNGSQIESSYILNKDNFRENIKCSKSGCFDGGLEIGNILRNMVDENIENLEKIHNCKGKIGSPNGQKIYGNGIC